MFFTLAFALWVYFFHRPLFSFMRTVFLLTTLLAVFLYEAFPLAPPRLAQDVYTHTPADAASWDTPRVAA